MKDAGDKISIIFPFKLKFFSLLIERDKSVTKFYNNTIYQHLLFSDQFSPQSLNLYLSPEFFNNGDVSLYFAEIIKRRNPLYFVSMIVYPLGKKHEVDNYNLDSEMYGKLFGLIRNLKQNESIKVLAFSINGPNKIVVPPE
eukprot:CAMPEP_0170526076 /NCGR_PEP_ID=MMETSP0209-20121228/11543_1 /TAXON_ID=665100 ORGANISM="Litonotus pictus, Strain P1" /NCGR_SAMPLE_ID=MMETSP0209 /ASSEMBLY_ACC=CAM_ASM_000301 /LENGTH=140 /DNA_ID=CAMNT_0010815719 /DNA_START=304 /DNA_END=723 /DNA_ORIENTATION=-